MDTLRKEITAAVAILLLAALIAGLQYTQSTVGSAKASTNAADANQTTNVGVHKPQVSSGKIEANVPTEVLRKCESLCQARKIAGINGVGCISANINGFACAIVENGRGHCLGFYRGVPEIDLDINCNMVGVLTNAG